MRTAKLSWHHKEPDSDTYYVENGVRWRVVRPAPPPTERFVDDTGMRWWVREQIVVRAVTPRPATRPGCAARRGRERRPGSRRATRRTASRAGPSDQGDDPEPGEARQQAKPNARGAR